MIAPGRRSRIWPGPPRTPWVLGNAWPAVSMSSVAAAVAVRQLTGLLRQGLQQDRVGGKESDGVGHQADHRPAASSADLREERTRPPNVAALAGRPAERRDAG